MNEPVAWYNADDSSLSFKNHGGGWQPLYAHQYERPHNTVLVPCDKLAEMQAEIEALKAFYEDRLESGRKREETMLKTIEALLRKAGEK